MSWWGRWSLFLAVVEAVLTRRPALPPLDLYYRLHRPPALLAGPPPPDPYLSRHFHPGPTPPILVYHPGESESRLEECGAGQRSVCSRLHLYDEASPWLERQCRCPNHAPCPTSLTPADGHTIIDKTRQLKVCGKVSTLPECRYFSDTAWTVTVSSKDNRTEQEVECMCPRGSVAYLVSGTPYSHNSTYKYSFACSPQSRLRCGRKEPCRLFTVRKREELVEEVNTVTVCGCGDGLQCPTHHTQPGVLLATTFHPHNIRTYSAYCSPT